MELIELLEQVRRRIKGLEKPPNANGLRKLGLERRSLCGDITAPSSI